MKIILTATEVEAMKGLMEGVEQGSVKEFVKGFNDNVLANVTWNTNKDEITLEVDSEYMTEYIATSGDFLKILVMQAKSLLDTVKLMYKSTQNVLVKHLAKAKKRKNTDTKATKKEEVYTDDIPF